MSDKAKALCLVLVLMVAILVGQFWATAALLFMVHVAVGLILEMVVSRLRWAPPSRRDD